MASLEAIDTTFGVDNLFFTGKERVRRTRNVHFDERVGVAIFPFDSFVGLSRRLRQKRKARLIVAKYDRAVVLWVNTAFHNYDIVQEDDTSVKELVSLYKNSISYYNHSIMSELFHLNGEVIEASKIEVDKNMGERRFKIEAVGLAIDIMSAAGFVSVGQVTDPDDQGKNHLRRSAPLCVPPSKIRHLEESAQESRLLSAPDQLVIAELERRRSIMRGSQVVAVAFGVGETIEEALETKIRVTPNSYIPIEDVQSGAVVCDGRLRDFELLRMQAKAALEFAEENNIGAIIFTTDT